ncbi:MAG: sigma-70 family RNA polymerase sigma factor, partial [Turicibacter sp.]
KLKQKDPKALEYLMDTYTPQVYFLIKRIIGMIASHEDVEEMVSDVFVSVWKDIDQFDEKRGTLQTFVFLKARTQALNFKRVHERHSLKVVYDKEIDLNTVSDSNQLIDKVESNVLVEVINRFIDKMKEPDKSYFVMRYFLYYDLKSIASAYKTTVKAVESSLYRSKKQLKTNMSEEGYHG